MSLNRYNDNYPASARFAARLARIEQYVKQTGGGIVRRNASVLDAIECGMEFDIWDGRLDPNDVEARFREAFKRLVGWGHVADDGSIGGRLDRLRRAAAVTYAPTNSSGR